MVSMFGSNLTDLGKNMIAADAEDQAKVANERSYMLGLAQNRTANKGIDTTAATANKQIDTTAATAKMKLDLDSHIADLQKDANDKTLSSHERIAAQQAANNLEQIRLNTQGQMDVMAKQQQGQLDMLKANPMMGNPQAAKDLMDQRASVLQKNEDAKAAAAQADILANNADTPWYHSTNPSDRLKAAYALLGDKSSLVTPTVDEKTGKVTFKANSYTVPDVPGMTPAPAIHPTPMLGQPPVAPPPTFTPQPIGAMNFSAPGIADPAPASPMMGQPAPIAQPQAASPSPDQSGSSYVQSSRAASPVQAQAASPMLGSTNVPSSFTPPPGPQPLRYLPDATARNAQVPAFQSTQAADYAVATRQIAPGQRVLILNPATGLYVPMVQPVRQPTQ